MERNDVSAFRLELKEEIKVQTKLDRNNIEDIIPLTPTQEGMLFHYILDPDSSDYHEQISLGLVGDINPDLLQEAWDFVIRKNEMLRVVYRWKGIEKPIQVVLKNHQVVMSYYDLSKQEERLNEIKEADLRSRIDIEKETLRIALCKCGENDYTMMISNHHILYDGWSNGIMIKELIDAYHALYKGLEAKMPFKNKFSEYVQWARSQDKAKQKEYWENCLYGVQQNDDLFKRAHLSEMKSYEYVLGQEANDQMMEFIKRNGISVATLLYCAWAIVAGKLNNTHDIMFGVTTSGRNQPIKGIENMIGLFINTIPLRVQFNEEETTFQLLKKVHEAIKEGQEFESTPLVDINGYAGLSNQSQLFNSLVVIENYPLNPTDYQDGLLRISDYAIIERTNYNLTLGITVKDFVTLNFQYNCFKDDEMIVRIGHYFERALSAMIFEENNKIVDIELLSREERNKILYTFNDTDGVFPREKTLHQLFEEQVKKTPDHIALVSGEESMTYKELNAKSNQMARLLREKDVKPNHLVGIMVERSPLMIIGILAILKSGGAYLPIDPDYPEERIIFMLADSGGRVLLTQSWLNGQIDFSGETINLDDIKLYPENTENLEESNSSTDLAYVIYTSGSTGRPKGVMVEHRNVVNLAIGQKNKFNITECDRILQLSTISFDASVEQIFISLFSGATLYLIDNATLLDQFKFNTFMQDNMITHLHGVPSFLDWADLKGLDNLRRIIGGGEEFSTSLAKKLNVQLAVYNEYGPTETTVTSLMSLVNLGEESSTISIGRPIANYQAYILSTEGKLSPIGIPGELYISGVGVTRGYLNRPELTAEKFIPNPFVEGERMYRTGDLARWLPDGRVEFLGRIDDQVKVRGFRLELGEIENRLVEFEGIKEAVVLAKEDKAGDKYLCAYTASEEKLSTELLKAHLSKYLPSYMIHSVFIQLASLPLMPNGKVNRKALPEPEGKVEAEYVAPRNVTEEILVQIWSEVLGKEKIGIYDNFFELGGHSLKATVLTSRIHKELDVELPLKELFRVPTIFGISEYLLSAKESIYAGIEAVEVKEYYEASSAQKRMWLLQQFDHESTAYNMPGVLILEGDLDQHRLEEVFSNLIKRHESLRTSFDTVADVIVQRITERIDFEIEYTERTEEDVEESIQAFIRPFDLNQAPLLRVGLVKTSADRHYLMFDMHHIISDGVSMSILTKEFMALYDGQKLEGQRIGYKDFSEWQNEYLKSERMQEQESYWLKQFSDELPRLNLPLDYPRPAIQSLEGRSVELRLDSELTKRLNNLAQEAGATLYMVLLSAVNILLSKYTRQDDIVIGSPIAGRPHADLEGIIGMFVNTLAMRNYPMSDKIYDEFLREVKETALTAYENQSYQFEELVDKVNSGVARREGALGYKLNLHRDLSRNPLLDVMFSLQNTEVNEFEIEGLRITEHKSGQTSSKFDLTFTAAEIDDEIIFSIEYRINLFKDETIERMGGYLRNLLNVITKSTDIKLGEIELLSETERNKILYEFNNTYVEYPREQVLHQLFEEQAKKTPDNVALVFTEERMTYRELNEKSNQMARLLREKGVKPDQLVGIMVDRSLEMIIGILGILKAGGAYLPIDPEYPEERIKFMIEDSESTLLLTQSWLSDRIEFNGKKIDLDDAKLYPGNAMNIGQVNRPTDLAYVIYTSGTTGNPKGVMIEHRSVLNLVEWQRIKGGYTETTIVLQNFNYIFDGSVWEIFPVLLSGCVLEIIAREEHHNVKRILELFPGKQIMMTPSMFKTVLDYAQNYELLAALNGFERLYLGGEALPYALLEKYKKISGSKLGNVYNAYGPTEATVCATIFGFNQSDDQILIGKPVGNTQVYIMNDNMLCGIGISGELCISGDGLARGYLNRPDLTVEKFVPNPFVKGERLYRTGDLARWLPDGNIEYLGRIDDQVKVRGFRIELGEIESQLLKLEAVKEAAVLAKKGEVDDHYLCAYIVSEEEIVASELRACLSVNLPDYMIPPYFVRLEEMPLTANGKLDRKALPEPEGKAEAEYVAPRNKTEEILAKIWSEMLGKEQIGIYDNFFELGGHSLKATVMISRVHKELNIELPLKELFRVPTILGISEYLSSATESVYSGIKPVVEKEYYEASSAQKRMWLLQQFDDESTGYNMPGVLILDGYLDKHRLEYVFLSLIKRHESLRTTFDTVNDVVIQRVIECIDFEIEYAESTEEGVEEVIKSFIYPFDLSQAPLLRVGLIKTSGERHYLLLDMHHIISDGVSMSILTKEFMALYDGQELEEQRISYKDFSQWQNEYLKSAVMQEQENYWLEQFSDEIPLLNLPFDYTRPPVQSFEGGSVELRLGRELTERLNNLARQTGTTLYMVLLSAVNILLLKYTSQEDIVIGSPIAGRPHADLEGIIGMFVNTLVMRNYPVSNKTYVEFLAEVKETALTAFENQGYQFEELVDKLNLRRDLSRNPLFDVMFSLQNTQERKLEIEGLHFTEYRMNQKVAKFDVTFTATEVEREIVFDVEYSVNLFKQETIERMVVHFNHLLCVIVENTTIQLGDIDLLSEGERKQLLYEFNDTYGEYPRDKTLQQLFEQQVKRTPDHVALQFNEKQMSYHELNVKSNQLARRLRAHGVKPDHIVGIMVERSLEMIIGILGILKSGGAYLPIDPEYPEERIKFMLEDSGTDILLTQSWLSGKGHFDGKRINLDQVNLTEGRTVRTNCAQAHKVLVATSRSTESGDSKCGLAREAALRDDLKTDKEDARDLEIINSPRDLAYVIYTSGSTGMPKGVMVEHGGVVNLAVGQKNIFGMNESDRVAQFYSISFDPFVEQMFTALLSGASLHLISHDILLDKHRFSTFILNNGITHLDAVPSFLDAIDMKDLGNLKRVMSSGEACPVGLVKKLNKLNFYNSYGPTETTVTSNMYLLNSEDTSSNIPIGKPITNYKAYILQGDQLSPLGIPGELCISGDGLARGYLNRPALTMEKFVPNPFVEGQRLYRTGDLARWLPDGNIEFLGRIDHQVKIRGFRIELGEVESQILKLDRVKETAVLAREDPTGSHYLCAYVVASEELLASDLRDYLSVNLPDYMIPSYFISMEKLPLTANGKLDRKALPEPDVKLATYVPPRNEKEELLAQIWCEVLGREKISVDDNFFEIGGHSLKATVLVSRIHKELNIKIPLKEIFRAPTIAGLCKCLADLNVNMYEAIEALPAKEHYEVSYTQKRMWIINQLNPNSPMFNMPGHVTLYEEVDSTMIQKIFDKLLERHEAFRTRFEELAAGSLVQIIDEKSDLQINEVDLLTLPPTAREQERTRIYEELATKIFDLRKGQLIDVKLIKVNEKEYDLIFCMHHIISDGWSMDVLKEQFFMLYEAYKHQREIELNPLRIQYKDFASWQNRMIKSKGFSERAKAFWTSQLSGEMPILNLPIHQVNDTDDKTGSAYKIVLAENIKDRLKALAHGYHTSLFIVLITTFISFLSELTKQDDILIGMPTFGRGYEDLHHVIGCFVNTTILRNKINNEEAFSQILKTIDQNTLNALEYQDYPLELIFEVLDIKYPKISAFFNMLNFEESANDYLADLNSEHIAKTQDVKFDFEWYVTEYLNAIQIDCVYNAGLFEPKTVEYIMIRYHDYVIKVAENPEKQLKDYFVSNKRRKF